MAAGFQGQTLQEDKPQGPSTCQASACIVLSNVPLADAGHVAKPSQCRRGLHRSIHSGHQCYGCHRAVGATCDNVAQGSVRHLACLHLCAQYTETGMMKPLSERLWGEGALSGSEDLAEWADGAGGHLGLVPTQEFLGRRG